MPMLICHPKISPSHMLDQGLSSECGVDGYKSLLGLVESRLWRTLGYLGAQRLKPITLVAHIGKHWESTYLVYLFPQQANQSNSKGTKS